MTSSRFDQLAKSLSRRISRRTMNQMLAALPLIKAGSLLSEKAVAAQVPCSSDTRSWSFQTDFNGSGSTIGLLASPASVALSPDGLTAWVVDSGHHRISVWTRPDASSTNWSNQTTFGGPGSGISQFDYPAGIAAAPNGRTLWIAQGAGRISVWIRPDAASTTWTPQATFGNRGDGQSELSLPVGLTASADGRTVWVADQYNHRVSIWTRPDAGSTNWTHQLNLGSKGMKPEQFNRPFDVAVSQDDLTLWVADRDNGRVSVWTRPDARSSDWSNQTTFGGFFEHGHDGVGSAAGVSVSPDGRSVWVIGSGMQDQISIWTRPTANSTNWIRQSGFGSYGDDNDEFDADHGLVVSPDGMTVLAVDTGNDRISVWKRPTIASTDWTHETNFGGSSSIAKQFDYPSTVSASPDGLTLWVTDSNDNIVSVWTRSEASSTQWTRQATFGGSGRQSDQFTVPYGISNSPDGLTIWVSDWDNDRISVWTRPNAASPDWTHQTNFGSDGPDKLDHPLGVVAAPDGLTVWVADSGNFRISVWTRTNTTSTNWSHQTSFGGEGRRNAQFLSVRGIAVSPDGLIVWIADRYSNRISVWTRPDAASAEWTHQANFGSEGTAIGHLHYPMGVAASPDGLSVWVADELNYRVSVWTRPDPTSTSWSNQTTFGSEGSDTGKFGSTDGITVSPDGLTVWVADGTNSRISVWTLDCLS